MSVASDTYFAGLIMQPNSQQYAWANRSYQPLQPSQDPMNQQNPPPQSYPTSEFPVGYTSQPNSQATGFFRDIPEPSYSPAPSYASGPPGGMRHTQPNNPSMLRPYPPSPAGPPPDPNLLSPTAPYMMNQPGYYLPEAPPVPSSHTPSMSSQTSSMVTEPMFSPTEPIPSTEPDQSVRVSSSRPRARCWDHGCNGREFSTFSNLLRHQREKSGVVAKAECPVCGAVFTRTTARNIHVAQGKCKGAGQESSAE